MLIKFNIIKNVCCQILLNLLMLNPSKSVCLDTVTPTEFLRWHYSCMLSQSTMFTPVNQL